VLIAFVRREQGLLLPPGNPMALRTIADVAAQRARVAQRPRGAGAQLLLIALLKHDGCEPESLAAGPVCPTGTDLAQAVRAGHADCGIASRSAAAAAGLDFEPILWERFDLAIRQRDYFRPPLQKLMAFMRTSAFARRAEEMTGYDVSQSGEVRYVG
jgi:putative molybdopterin biosynthesis protein